MEEPIKIKGTKVKLFSQDYNYLLLDKITLPSQITEFFRFVFFNLELNMHIDDGFKDFESRFGKVFTELLDQRLKQCFIYSQNENFDIYGKACLIHSQAFIDLKGSEPSMMGTYLARHFNVFYDHPGILIFEGNKQSLVFGYANDSLGYDYYKKGSRTGKMTYSGEIEVPKNKQTFITQKGWIKLCCYAMGIQYYQ